MQNQPSDAQLKDVSEKFYQELKLLEQSNKWEQSDTDPCPIYKIEIEDRVVTKAEVTIKLPFDIVLNYFSDPLFMKKLSDQVEDAKVLYQNQDIRVIFVKMAGFGPVSSREIVAVNSVRREGNKAYIGNRSCNYIYVSSDADAVRAEVHVGGYILQKIGENETKVVSITNIDIKGSVPQFIVNKMSSKRAASLVAAQEKIKAALH